MFSPRPAPLRPSELPDEVMAPDVSEESEPPDEKLSPVPDPVSVPLLFPPELTAVLPALYPLFMLPVSSLGTQAGSRFLKIWTP